MFFVISGYLITAHLLKEISSSGRIALAPFYARRARRLLPAAFLVLAVSAAASIALLPYPRWARTGAEVLASAAYVENWFLSGMSVNYSALNDLATPVQHYWSLSVEEQFYLLWPLLLIGSWWLSSRLSSNPRRAAGVTLGVLVVVSLGLSVHATALAPNQAYFVTHARAWEFGIGGLVALLPAARLSRPVAEVLSLSGFATIAFAVVTFDSLTPFPGWTALLPVMGSAAVIIGGTGRTRLLHTPVTSTRPVQWLGDISYSLYLWHWPLMVLTPFLLSGTLTTWMKLGVLATALIVSDLTRRLVEKPGQRWPMLRDSTRRTFLAMVLAMLLVAALTVSMIIAGKVRTDADIPPKTMTIEACTGPQALDAASSCDDPFGPARESVMGPVNAYFYTPPGCVGVPDLLRFGGTTATVRCDFSAGRESPTEVWLVGDSHAEQFKGPIIDIARKQGWVLTTSFGGGCPVIDAPFEGFRTQASPADKERCRTWSRAVQDAIALAAPDLVFTSSAARVQMLDDGTGRTQSAQFTDGLERTWRRWISAGSTVVALGGVPFNGEVRSPDCVVLNREAPRACAVPVEVANPPDPYLAAAVELADSRAIAFDASPYFCDQEQCFAVVGGIAVYYDADHLNLDYARRLAPELMAVVERVL